MKGLIIKLLFVLGFALTWRLAQWLMPTVGMAIVGAALLVGLAILYVKHPIFKQTLSWAWLVALGAGLNFAAIIGNGGMMPYLDNLGRAWWTWLGDWLPLGFSPGDIIMIVGFLGIAATLIIAHRRLAYET